MGGTGTLEGWEGGEDMLGGKRGRRWFLRDTGIWNWKGGMVYGRHVFRPIS